jgi:hypothetical protein
MNDSGESGTDSVRAAVVLDPAQPAQSVRAEHRADLGGYVLHVPVRPRDAATGPASRPSGGDDVRSAALVPFYLRANCEADTRWVTFLPVASP